MTTSTLPLSATQALGSSLSYIGDFFRRHWILASVYVVLGCSPAFIAGDSGLYDLSLVQSLSILGINLLFFIPVLLLMYYAIKEAVEKIDPGFVMSRKSTLKSVLQIILMNIITAFLGVLLTILFILPGIWWSTKASVSFANLLTTDDGVLDSIKKSHELMNGKFWQCLGFLAATYTVVFLVLAMIAISVCFMVIVGAFNSILHEGGFARIPVILQVIMPIIGLTVNLILFYVQAWLYVYLKNQATTPNIVAVANTAQ